MSRARHSGFTLPELTVALVVAIVAGLALIQALYTARVNATRVRIQDRMTTRARFATFSLRHAVSVAGFQPIHDALSPNNWPARDDLSPALAAGSAVAAGQVDDDVAVSVRFASRGQLRDCTGTIVGTDMTNGGQRIVQRLSLDGQELLCSVYEPGVSTPARTAVLLDHVRALRLSFGIDSDHNGSADARSITLPVTQQDQVVSIHAECLIESDRQRLDVSQSQTFVFSHGDPIAVDDGRIYRRIDVTSALRNRLE